MKLWSVLRDAGIGWIMLVRAEAGWREQFRRTPAGLTTALAVFVFMTFLAVAITSVSVGLASLFGVIAGMFALALPLISLVLVLLGTRMALKSTEPMLDVLVPATYALTVFVLAEGLLAILGGPVVMLAWLGLGYVLYRLMRAATTWNAAIAAGVAVLTVLLLVAMRLALYMLSSAASPI